MHPELFYNKRLLITYLLLLAGGIVYFVYTASMLALLAPVLLLYLLFFSGNWKQAYWLMLVCIPLSVQVNLAGDTLSTSVPDEPMTWLFFILFFLLIAHRSVYLPKWWLQHSLTLIIALQFIWLIIAVVYAQVQLPAFKFLLAKAWYLVAFFVFPVWILKEKKDYKIAFLTLLLPMLLTMCIITVRHKASGFQFMAINAAIGKLYYNHVEYAAVLSMFFPFLFTALSLTNKKQFWQRVLLAICILFFVAIILLTYSRAAILGIAFGVGVAIAIRLRLVQLVMPALYGVLALLMVYLVTDNKYMEFTPNYEQTYMHHNFKEHLVATFAGKDMSTMERVYRWIAAVRMSEEHPLTGFGPHGFVQYYKPYAVASFRTYVSNNYESSTTHNYFLLMLTEQGWPAMILYAILMALAFVQAQKIYHRTADKFYKAIVMSIAAMLAICFVNNFFSELIETHKVAALFYLGLAAIVLIDNKVRSGEDAATSLHEQN